MNKHANIAWRVARYPIIAVAVSVAVMVGDVISRGTLSVHQAIRIIVYAFCVAALAVVFELVSHQRRKRASGNTQ